MRIIVTLKEVKKQNVLEEVVNYFGISVEDTWIYSLDHEFTLSQEMARKLGFLSDGYFGADGT